MPRVRLPGFTGPSYTSESRIAAYDRTVNLIPEKIESGTGQATYISYLAPGYTPFCTLPETPVRGFYTLNGVSYAIGNETLYQLPTTLGGSPMALTTGVTNPDNSWVTIAGNGDAGHQLALSSGSFKFCFDLLTNMLTLQTGLAQQVGFLATRFLAVDTARSEISFSAPEDGTSWDPLDVIQREDAPDKWVSMLVHQSGREIWLFGTQTSSVYYPGNDPSLPFVPNPSVFITQGIAAANSAAVLKGSPIWLGQGIGGGGRVYWANGYTPTPVSTAATELAWSAYSTVADAHAEVYEERGHSFYVLTFPNDGTWVFDATTGFWHERGLPNGWGDFDALPIIGHLYANGVHLVASRTTGVIYQQSKSLLTSTTGDGIVWLRRCPHVAKDHLGLIIDRAEILMEVGLGLATGQGSNPQIALRWSRNGGQTWSPLQTVTFGAAGAFLTRCIWRQLGWGRDWVFEASGSDPVPDRLIDMLLDLRAQD